MKERVTVCMPTGWSYRLAGNDLANLDSVSEAVFNEYKKEWKNYTFIEHGAPFYGFCNLTAKDEWQVPVLFVVN